MSDSGERSLISTRPSPWMILDLNVAVVAAILALVAVWLVGRLVLGPGALDWAPLIAGAGLAIALAVSFLDWFFRRYELTTERIVVVAGVLWRVRGELPLSRVQDLTLARSPLQRVFGAGTIIAESASGGGVAWVWAARPHDAMGTIRGAADRHAPSERGRQGGKERVGGVGPGVPVIGLAGGVGSGKSTVAQILASLGCLVSESDRQARAALDRPDVRAELVKWWGDREIGGKRGILDEEGRVDRRAVADIVFADAAERRRLEALVHPIIRRDRAALLEEASRMGARAVVIDAPLLFEAGLDAECDAVIFVDAPRELRVRRVAETRSWDEGELARREAGQWALDRKRESSGFVVMNDGSRADLEVRVKRALGAIEASAGKTAGDARPLP